MSARERSVRTFEADVARHGRYLYAIGYYGFLQHPPDDGPGIAAEQIEGLEDSGVDINTGMNNALRRVRRDLRTMVRNQLAADRRKALTEIEGRPVRMLTRSDPEQHDHGNNHTG